MSVVQSIEWENETVRLVKLSGLPLHPNFPFNWTKRSKYFRQEGRRIRRIFAHQTAGSKADGLDAAIKLAEWVILPPRYKLDEYGNVVYRKTRSGKRKPVVLGGGRGWPGPGYTFLVPYRPEVQDRRFVVYRLWDDEWHTWHTGDDENEDGVGVAWSGSFRTRHAPTFSTLDPHPTAMEAGQSLIVDYLLPRYNLKPDALRGHFDAGKPTCPGDAIEEWVRQTRGEDFDDRENAEEATAKVDMRPLDTWRQRQAALVDLGFDVGPAGVDGVFGFATRRAVEAFQDSVGLVSDGVWGPRTEAAMRRALKGSE